MIKKEEKKIVYHVEYGIIPARFLSNKRSWKSRIFELTARKKQQESNKEPVKGKMMSTALID